VKNVGVLDESSTTGTGVKALNNSAARPAAIIRNAGTGDHLIIGDEGKPALRVGKRPSAPARSTMGYDGGSECSHSPRGGIGGPLTRRGRWGAHP